MGTGMGAVDAAVAYDVLVELATRIGGECVARADAAASAAEGRRWRDTGVRVRRRVRSVDPLDRGAVESATGELRSVWASMGERAPVLSA